MGSAISLHEERTDEVDEMLGVLAAVYASALPSASLAEVSRAVSSVMGIILRRTQARSAFLYLWDDEAMEFLPVGIEGACADLPSLRRLVRWLVPRLGEEREAVWIGDLAADPELGDVGGIARTAFVLPVRFGGSRGGVLGLLDPDPRRAQGYLNYLTLASHSVLAAARQHLLGQEMSRRNAELTKAKTRLEAALGELESRQLAIEASAVELRRANERLALNLQCVSEASDAIVIADVHRCVLYANRAFSELTGHDPEEAVGRELEALIPPAASQLSYDEAWRVLPEGGRWSGEMRSRTKCGREYIAEVTLASVKGDAGRSPACIAILRDVTDRRATHEALEKERQFIRAVLDTLEAGIVACDSEGILTTLNRAAREFHGGRAEAPISLDDLAERYDLFHPDGKTRMRKEELPLFRALQGETVRGVEMMIVPKEGAARRVLVSGQPVVVPPDRKLGAVVAAQDITEQKQLEEQLRQSQKMEAIGRLAGGIAHDFNNLLGVIMGYSELMLKRLSPADPLRRNAEEVRKAADRAAALTHQLLAFSRKQVLQPKTLNVNTVVTDMHQMLRRLIGEDIELLTEPEPALGWVKADSGQLEQVLVNLAVNARDAMPHGGKLTIETGNADLGEADVRRRPAFRPGRYVLLAVSDTGCGMDAQTQARIFEPFFTTKELGKGTGLGLSTVYGIVKQSGGYIWVYSEPGLGTTFKIYLPRVEAADGSSGKAPAVAPPVQGHETVLVVEDEAAVRALICEVLRESGYAVVSAGGPHEALAICERHAGPIQLTLTDVVMPQMGGRELAGRIALLRPDSRILYMSGYTDGAIVQHGVLEPGIPFIQKPFTPDALARKVREVLDKR